jgi:hypothetical protein
MQQGVVGQNFPNATNGFNHGQGAFPGSYQNRMSSPGFQPRFPQQLTPQQSQNIPPPGGFVPRKIGQVNGVDVLTTRPPETRPQKSMFQDQSMCQ